jgi:hypothetical protein
MSCCAPSIPRNINGAQLLEKLRNFKEDKNITMKLKEGFNYEFDAESGRWKEKFDIKHTSNLEELNVVVNNLKETLNKKHLEIKILEKRYLARMAKLLLMAQTHCEIKDNILDIFEEGIGVKKKHILEEETEEEKEFITNLDNIHEKTLKDTVYVDNNEEEQKIEELA